MPIAAISAKARAFSCPSCGGPIALGHENISSVGCESCGAVTPTLLA